MPVKHHYLNIRPPAADLGFEGTRFAIYRCEFCTWFRIRTNTVKWDTTIIDHPVYGHVSNWDAYIKDRARHDCRNTAQARIRLGINPGEFTLDRYDRKVSDGSRT